MSARGLKAAFVPVPRHVAEVPPADIGYRGQRRESTTAAICKRCLRYRIHYPAAIQLKGTERIAGPRFPGIFLRSTPTPAWDLHRGRTCKVRLWVAPFGSEWAGGTNRHNLGMSGTMPHDAQADAVSAGPIE